MARGEVSSRRGNITARGLVEPKVNRRRLAYVLMHFAERDNVDDDQSRAA
jgi:hypothetical protein